MIRGRPRHPRSMNPYTGLKVTLGRWATRVEFRNPENKLTQRDISELLRAWSEGDQAALEQIIPLVYNELRRMAAGYLRRRGAQNRLEECRQSFLRSICGCWDSERFSSIIARNFSGWRRI